MAKKSPIKIKPENKGKLSAKMGVPESKNLNASDLSKILNAEPNEKVKLSTGKTVTATASTKKQANFARNAKKFKR
jgi:hypothetical protein